MASLILMMLSLPLGLFRTQAAMQAEIIALRHQVIVLQRTQKTKRLDLHRTDQWLWVWLSQLWSGWRYALIIVKPETVLERRIHFYAEGALETDDNLMVSALTIRERSDHSWS